MITVSVVIAVRIPRKLREELRELGIDYVREIREFLVRRVREEKARRLVREVREFRGRLGFVGGNLSVVFIREDRDA